MDMSAMIKIDNDLSIPIYKQIADNIMKLIYSGDIEFGEFLPSERVLAQELNIARGTVKKAYEELEKQDLVSANVGKGTKVIKSKEIVENEELEIDKLLKTLVARGYSLEEIDTLVFSRLRILAGGKKIYVAVIDCNPEALAIFNRRIGEFPDNVEITNFLLEDVFNFKSPVKALSGFDLIITTSTHYEELLEITEEIKEKLVKIVLAPDIDTIMSLTLLNNEVKDKDDKIGVYCLTERFKNIVSYNLKDFNIHIDSKDFLYQKDSLELIEKFLEGKKAIIMPPYYAMSLGSTMVNSLYNFRDRGGIIVIFNYTVEKGSLLHIEEKFQTINRRMNNG